MDIINVKVYHKNFGCGVITAVEEKLVTVLFESGIVKKFQYPQSLGTSLTVCEEKTRETLKGEVCRILEDERLKKEAEREKLKSMPSLDRKSSVGDKRSDRPNIAFKCTYCDGGKSDSSLGFYGVCSDRIIEYNVCDEKHSWCSNEKSLCRCYLEGVMSRTELDAWMYDVGYVCYESQMLRDWTARAGVHQSGARKGEPMKLRNIGTGSLCVLTTRTPCSAEEERLIFAVFLVDRTFDGDENQSGFVKCESKYKLSLTPKQAKKMPFWKYYANSNSPEKAMWGTGLHRYFEDICAVQILRDIAKIKKGTADEALALEFLEKFCAYVGISPKQAGDPFGMLAL